MRMLVSLVISAILACAPCQGAPPGVSRAQTVWGRTQGCLPLDENTKAVLCSAPDQPQQAAQFCLTTHYCQCNKSRKWAVSGRTTFFGVAGGRSIAIYVYTIKVQVFNAYTKVLINTTYTNCKPNTPVQAYSSLECDYRALIDPIPANQGYGVYPVLNTCCNRPCRPRSSATAGGGREPSLRPPPGSNLLTVVPGGSLTEDIAGLADAGIAIGPTAIGPCDNNIC